MKNFWEMSLNLLKSLQSKNDLKQIGFLFYKPTTFEFWFIIVYILLFPFINEKKIRIIKYKHIIYVSINYFKYIH